MTLLTSEEIEVGCSPFSGRMGRMGVWAILPQAVHLSLHNRDRSLMLYIASAEDRLPEPSAREGQFPRNILFNRTGVVAA